jgi:hypothetical protein
VLRSLEERYRRSVALAYADVRRYVRAGGELRQAVALTVLAVAVPLALYYLGILQDPLFLAVVGAGLGVAVWVRVLDTVTRVSSVRRRLEEELPFAVLMAAAASRTGLELVEALRYLGNSRALRAFGELGRRFYSLSDALGASEGLRLLARLAGGRTRLMLAEYSAALSAGIALQQLRDRASDFVRSVGAQVARSLDARVAAATVVSMVLTVAPVLLISFSTLTGLDIATGEIRVPGWANLVAPATCLAAFLATALAPGYPLAVSVVYEQGFLRLLRVLAVAGTAVLLYPMACCLIAGGFSSRSELAVLALAAAALGTPGFYYTVRASRSRVGDVVEEAANHVRVFRTMHLFRSARLEALQRARARPWLVDYLSEALGFLRLVGDVDPAVFEVFVEYVFEVERAVSKASFYMLTLSASALLAPYLATATISIGTAFGLTAATALLGYSTTLAFAYVATKMALGATVSTLLPGLAVLLYALTLP